MPNEDLGAYVPAGARPEQTLRCPATSLERPQAGQRAWLVQHPCWTQTLLAARTKPHQGAPARPAQETCSGPASSQNLGQMIYGCCFSPCGLGCATQLPTETGGYIVAHLDLRSTPLQCLKSNTYHLCRGSYHHQVSTGHYISCSRTPAITKGNKTHLLPHPVVSIFPFLKEAENN